MHKSNTKYEWYVMGWISHYWGASACTRSRRRDGTPASAACRSPPSTACSSQTASGSQSAGERPPSAASRGTYQSQGTSSARHIETRVTKMSLAHEENEDSDHWCTGFIGIANISHVTSQVSTKWVRWRHSSYTILWTKIWTFVKTFLRSEQDVCSVKIQQENQLLFL